MSTATQKSRASQTKQKQRADAARMPELLNGVELRAGRRAGLIEAFRYQPIMTVGEMIARSGLGSQEMDALLPDWVAADRLEKLVGFPVRYRYKGHLQ